MPKMFLNLNQDYFNIIRGTSGEYLIFMQRPPDFTTCFRSVCAATCTGWACPYLEYTLQLVWNKRCYLSKGHLPWIKPAGSQSRTNKAI